MNPNNLNDADLQRLLQKAASSLRANDQTRAEIRQRVLAGAAAETKSLPASSMRRRWPWQLGLSGAAVAACLAVALVLWAWSGPDMATTAYAQVAEAVKNSKTSEWMYFKRTVKGQTTENWLSFKPWRQFTRTGQWVAAEDGPAQRRYSYDPTTRTLTIAYRNEVNLPFNSFMDYLAAQIQKVEGNPDYVVSRFNSDRANRQIQMIKFALAKEPNSWFAVGIDPQPKRVVEVELHQWQRETGKLEFEYSDHGPADIYALGVPRDAKVVENLPSADLIKLREDVERARANFAQTYTAVIFSERIASKVNGPSRDVSIYIVYKKNGRYRIERIISRTMKDVKEGTDQNGQPIPLDNLDQLAHWARQSFTLNQINFHDLRNSKGVICSLRNGELNRESTHPLVWGVPETYTWDGPMNLKTWTSGPAEAAKPGLAVAQHFRLGTVHSNVVSSPQEQSRVYFDPARDYLALVKEHVYDWQAPRQKDQHGLDSLTSEQTKQDPRNFVIRTQITEAAQTPAGQWYAKRMTVDQKGSDNFHTNIWILLDTQREIPDHLLDPASVRSAADLQPPPETQPSR